MARRKQIVLPDAPDEGLLPSGSTLLNLALSGNPYGAYAKGTLVNVIGDTHAGKTFLCWQMLAEMANDPAYSKYDLYYNDAESAFRIPVLKLFGKKAAGKVKYGPDYNERVVEEAFSYVKRVLARKRLVYIADSLDGMQAREEADKKDEKLGERDYPAKPRVLSAWLGTLAEAIEGSESLLVFVSQTRQNLGVKFGPAKRRTGGDALGFYCSYIFWLSVVQHFEVKGRDVGIIARVKVAKNKFHGRQAEVKFPIITDYGIDDVGSMVDWMVEEGPWKKEGKDRHVKENVKIKTEGDFIDATRKRLIKYIEEGDYEGDLRQLVTREWRKIEDEIASKRKARYE